MDHGVYLSKARLASPEKGIGGIPEQVFGIPKMKLETGRSFEHQEEKPGE